MPETYDVIIAALMEANLTVPPPLPTADISKTVRLVGSGSLIIQEKFAIIHMPDCVSIVFPS